MNADLFIATLERELQELADRQLAQNPVLRGILQAVSKARAAASSKYEGQVVVIGHGHVRCGCRGLVVGEADGFLIVRIATDGLHPAADVLVPERMVLTDGSPVEQTPREMVEMLYTRQRAASRQKEGSNE